MSYREPKENTESLRPKLHQHNWITQGTYDICSICQLQRLARVPVDGEERSMGVRKDGKEYSIRDNRMAWFYPAVWQKVYANLKSDKQRLMADLLIRTGARINEIKFIEFRDCDFERNTLRLRITKTKAKKGELKGKPRTLPMDSKFMKRLKKEFDDKGKLKLLTTAGFNMGLHNACEKAGMPDYYNYSAHSIRKTHGNWLKVLGNLGLIKIDSYEICLRLGHDMNTFLKDYGSSSVLDNRDIQIAKQILGDLYER